MVVGGRRISTICDCYVPHFGCAMDDEFARVLISSMSRTVLFVRRENTKVEQIYPDCMT